MDTDTIHSQISETLYADFLESSPDAIVGVNEDGNIILVNSQTERMFGHERSEMLGQPVEMLLPSSLRSAHRSHRAGYMENPHSRPMGIGMELSGLRKDGSVFPVEVSLNRVALSGDTVIFSAIRDITDRKNLEERLKRYAGELERLVEARTEALRSERDFTHQVIDHAKSLVLTLSVDGVIQLFNRDCESIWGYTAEEVIGQAWSAILLSAEERSRAEDLMTAVKNDRIPEVWQCPIRTRDGTLRPVQWHIGAVRDDRDRITGIVAIGHDMSKEQRLQEQLFQSERLALVGRMAAQVAHEIRNPLSAIGLNIELLADLIKDRHWDEVDEAKELIRITMSGIERLNGVIGDYLRFARMPVQQLQEESVNDLAEELIHLTRPEMESANVDLVVRFDGDLPPVRADRILIGQALLNCVRNALEAMSGGGTLTLTTRVQDSEVGISIADTGAGIAPEHIDRVFDPFFSTKEHGTGLGLPYVQQIIQEHHGRLALDSHPDAGTTVTLWFPTSRSEEP